MTCVTCSQKVVQLKAGEDEFIEVELRSTRLLFDNDLENIVAVKAWKKKSGRSILVNGNNIFYFDASTTRRKKNDLSSLSQKLILQKGKFL